MMRTEMISSGTVLICGAVVSSADRSLSPLCPNEALA